jgi:hypothetical protein
MVVEDEGYSPFSWRFASYILRSASASTSSMESLSDGFQHAVPMDSVTGK